MKLGCDHSQFIRISAWFWPMVKRREALHLSFGKLGKKKNCTLSKALLFLSRYPDNRTHSHRRASALHLVTIN